jgi:hypothetical protein
MHSRISEVDPPGSISAQSCAVSHIFVPWRDGQRIDSSFSFHFLLQVMSAISPLGEIVRGSLLPDQNHHTNGGR